MFSAKKVQYPEDPPRLGGLDEKQVATIQQARPLPILYGTQRIGVTFISNAFNQSAEPVTQEVSKKTDPVTIGYYYYCSFAAMVCAGPVDTLKAIIFDGNIVWAGSLARSSAYADVSVEGYGTIRIYWGTESQGIDPLLATLAADVVVEPNEAEEHTAYLGQCYIVAYNICMGYQRTNVANIELIVSRVPDVSWLTGSIVIGDDVSAAAVVANMLTDTRYGLALADTTAVIDRPGFQASHDSLVAAGLGVSPLIDRAQTFQSVVDELMGHIEGYVNDTADGKLTMGLIRAVPCGDPTNVQTLTDEDMTELPEIRVESIGGQRNDVRVRFRNGEAYYQDDATSGHASASLSEAEPNLTVIDRPWFTSAVMAERAAIIGAKSMAHPRISGALHIRRSRAVQTPTAGGAPLKPGDYFYLSLKQYRLCWLHCRIIEVEEPDPLAPEVVIQFEEDLGYLNAETFTPAPTTVPVKIEIEPAAAVHQELMELVPYAVPTDIYARRARAMLTVLADRPTATTSGGIVIEDVDGGGVSYTTARNIANWFIHGTLFARSMSASAETTTCNILIDSPIDTVIPAGLLDHGDAIAIIDTGRGVQEVCALTDFALSGPGIYWLRIERLGKYDTQMHSHAVGTGIWIGRYGWLKANAWQSISSVAYGGTLRVKVLPSAMGHILAAEDATPITCLSLSRYQRPLPPYRLTILPSQEFTGEGSFLPSWLRKYAGGDNVVPSWDSNPYFVTDMRLPGDAWDPDDPGDPYWLADTLAFDATSPVDYIEIPTFGGIYQTFKFRVGTRQNLVYYDSAEHGTLYCWEWAEATMTKI